MLPHAPPPPNPVNLGAIIRARYRNQFLSPRKLLSGQLVTTLPPFHPPPAPSPPPPPLSPFVLLTSHHTYIQPLFPSPPPTSQPPNRSSKMSILIIHTTIPRAASFSLSYHRWGGRMSSSHSHNMHRNLITVLYRGVGGGGAVAGGGWRAKQTRQYADRE
jgi:hypothetical protein